MSGELLIQELRDRAEICRKGELFVRTVKEQEAAWLDSLADDLEACEADRDALLTVARELARHPGSSGCDRCAQALVALPPHLTWELE